MPKKPTKSAAGYALGQSDEAARALRGLIMSLISAEESVSLARHHWNILSKVFPNATAASASALSKTKSKKQ